jgi:glutamate-1-semialdehyde 2,1-aminomutase
MASSFEGNQERNNAMTIEVVNGSSITSKRPGRVGTELRSFAVRGMKVMLEDGRELWDWQAGLHGAIFGMKPGWWVDALVSAASRNVANSVGCQDEQVVADLLGEFYPDNDLAVRFMLSGSDPCAAAVKLARAVTGSEKLLVYGYHGTCSAYASPPTDFDADDNRRGTMQAERKAYHSLNWLGIEGFCAGVESWRDLIGSEWSEVAAVIVECPPVDGGRDKAAEWLQGLAEWARWNGSLFILDEVVTGLRYGPGGAAEYYDLHGLVDLYALGKTLGNAYPVSALLGKREIMKELAGEPGKGLVHYSSTFNGEPLGMAVARATLERLKQERPWPYLYEMGEYLKDAWNGAGLPWKMVGHPTRPVLETAAGDGFGEFRLAMLAAGHILFAHPWYTSTVMEREDVDALIDCAIDVIGK